MHYSDLELCTYGSRALDAANWAVPLRAVGWLEHPNPFDEVPRRWWSTWWPRAGGVHRDVIKRLEQLVRQTREQFSQLAFLGVHTCSLCVAAGNNGKREGGWSQENLIIPGDGEVFVAPGGILHYVLEHSYLPPERFIQAVMRCPPCGSSEHLDALRAANGGKEIPLETADQWHANRRARNEAYRRFLGVLKVQVIGATREQIVAAAREVWAEGAVCVEPDGSVSFGDFKVAFNKDGHAIDIGIGRRLAMPEPR